MAHEEGNSINLISQMHMEIDIFYAVRLGDFVINIKFEAYRIYSL